MNKIVDKKKAANGDQHEGQAKMRERFLLKSLKNICTSRIRALEDYFCHIQDSKMAKRLSTSPEAGKYRIIDFSGG